MPRSRSFAPSVSRRIVAAMLPAALLALAAALMLGAGSPVATPPRSTELSLVAHKWTVNVSDYFHRSVRLGLGRARVGGRYVRHGRVHLAVSPGKGLIGPLTPGATAEVTLNSAHALDQVVRVRFALPRLVHRGNGT